MQHSFEGYDAYKNASVELCLWNHLQLFARGLDCRAKYQSYQCKKVYYCATCAKAGVLVSVAAPSVTI